jgi:hypothetical protein
MGIIDRLGNVIKSYLSDEPQPYGFDAGFAGSRRSADADLNAAFDELNEYLKQEDVSQSKSFNSKSYTSGEYTYKHKTSQNSAYKNDTFKNNTQSGGRQDSQAKLPPESLRPSFETLGVPFGASEADCKAARKNLLKKHHPDVHARHEGNRQKATSNAAGINAAFQSIQEWYGSSR